MPGYEIKTKDNLLKKHDLYRKNIKKWKRYAKAYENDDEFLEVAIRQNERETLGNYRRRLRQAVSFSYSSAVVDIFNHFLTQKTVHRDIGSLAQDVQWEMFYQNCDMNGTNLDDFLNNIQKISSIYGMAGILIDKPRTEKKFSIKKEIAHGIHPYLVSYSIIDIYDWEYVRNSKTGKLELGFLKLHLGDDAYMVWWQDKWEVWKIDPKNINKADSGMNPLGEIPFVFIFNIVSLLEPTLGVSDIVSVSRIQASIASNISCADEILNYAGFPMLRMPKRRVDDSYSTSPTIGLGVTDDSDEDDVVVSSSSVFEFDPENPDSKPDWLETKVLEPIRATLELIDRKTDEMYRTVHLSGIYNQRDKAQTKSGTALRYEYHQLNSVLSKKARNETLSEMGVLYFYLKWQNKTDMHKNITVKRSDEFAIDEMAETLDNMIKSAKEVQSRKFSKVVKKQIVEKIAPNISSSTKKIIFEEIDNTVEAFLNQDKSIT